jgi:hypothetical protein
VLSEATIVEVSPQAKRRIYQLKQEPFQELEVWLHSFRHLWEELFAVWITTCWNCRGTSKNTNDQKEFFNDFLKYRGETGIP